MRLYEIMRVRRICFTDVEARRLIAMGAVKQNGVVLEDPNMQIDTSIDLQIGRTFHKLDEPVKSGLVIPPAENSIKQAFINLLDSMHTVKSTEDWLEYNRLRDLMRRSEVSYLRLFKVGDILWIVRYSPSSGKVFYKTIVIE